MRTREEEPLLAGVMWGSPNPQRPLDIRHEARNEDNLQLFGWRRHDGRSFGEQFIRDGPLAIKTAFVKQNATRTSVGGDEMARHAGEGYGGRWTLQITAGADATYQSAEQPAPSHAALYVYFGSASEAGRALENVKLPDMMVRARFADECCLCTCWNHLYCGPVPFEAATQDHVSMRLQGRLAES